VKVGEAMQEVRVKNRSRISSRSRDLGGGGEKRGDKRIKRR